MSTVLLFWQRILPLYGVTVGRHVFAIATRSSRLSAGPYSSWDRA